MRKTKETIVKTLVQFLTAVKRSVSDSGGDKTKNLFTGIKDSRYDLTPSLFCKTHYLQYDHDLERTVIHGVSHHYPDLFDAEHPVSLRNLALLRHYGVHVRLMDTTTNPLVALWMACQPEKTTSGFAAVCILRFDENKMEVFDWQNPYFEEMTRLGFEPNGLGETEISKQYPAIARFIEHFGGFATQSTWDRLGTPKLVLCPYFTSRQRAQAGQFVFFPPHFNLTSDKTRIVRDEDCVGMVGRKRIPKPEAIKTLNKSLESKIARKLLIPRDNAKIILDDLRQFAGISQATLFPEDIDAGVKELVSRLGSSSASHSLRFM